MASEEAIEFLKNEQLDPDKRPQHIGPAIHEAVLQDRPAVLQALLKRYGTAYVDFRDDRFHSKKGRTPLHNAAQRNRVEIIRLLLNAGADVNIKTWGRWTALMLATEMGHIEVVNLLVEHKADLNAQTRFDHKDRSGLTALHLAAQLTSHEIILALLLAGADPEITTPDGETPLHFAIRARSVATTALLRARGAAFRTSRNGSESPLDLAHKLSVPERARFLHLFSCEHFDEPFSHLRHVQALDMADAMHWAAEWNLPGVITVLLHIDPHAVEAESRRGWSPLHRAARSNSDACVQVLLKHGARVDAQTRSGWTPLMLAAEKGYEDTVWQLSQFGADSAFKNHEGLDAVQVAVNARHDRIALYLEPALVLRVIENPNSLSDGDGAYASPTISRDKGVVIGDTLSPPGSRRRNTTPSPAPSRDERLTEGELFALSDAESGNQWLASPSNSPHVEKFFETLERTWYDKIQWTPEDDETSSVRAGYGGPVKIAILDTGIDLDHEDFRQAACRRTRTGQWATDGLPEVPQRKRIKAVKNFVGGDAQDVTDQCGHGTHIAGLILSIAPRAELYIAKVSAAKEIPAEVAPGEGRRNDQRRPIQEALHWAYEQGVDIINMSLGFQNESSYALTAALERANYEGVNAIVFAAAANHGNRHAIAWPARDEDLAICVTSGDDNYKPSSWAPGPSRDLSVPVFLTHGENVSSHWPTALGGGFRKMSGTSVATPIAVGMAAMVLAFLNKTNEWRPEQKRQCLTLSQERRLRTTRGMRKALEHMCDDRTGVKCLPAGLMWHKKPDKTALQALDFLARAFENIG